MAPLWQVHFMNKLAGHESVYYLAGAAYTCHSRVSISHPLLLLNYNLVL